MSVGGDTLADRMGRLLCTGVDADAHFLVGQGEEQQLLSAHKPILRVCSDVFDAMFRFDEGKKESGDPVEVPDVDAEAFRTMLEFIYTDHLDGVNGDNAVDVLYAAKKYNLPSLAKACVSVPIANFGNVFVAFDEARLLDEKDFAGRCLAYIDRNADTLFQSDEFLQIDQKLLCKILGRSQLVVSDENSIWNAALRWADAQCVLNGKECSGENRREMLGLALYKIRFPIMAKECLANIVSSGVLLSGELVSVLLYHSSAALSILYPLPFPIRRRSAKSTGKLTLNIDKFSEFAQSKTDIKRVKYNDFIYIGGFGWTIRGGLTTESKAMNLSFFIYCYAEEYGSNWSCPCSATLRIVSSKGEHADLVRKFTHTFRCSEPTGKLGEGFGWSQFATYQELMNPYNGWYDTGKDMVTLSADLTVELNEEME